MSPISDWNSLRIDLHRGFCFGICPAYGVEIHGDGTVIYVGEGSVAVLGRHKTHINPTAVRALAATFQKAAFFSLLDRYRASVTDGPTYEIAIAFDGKEKKVTDYMGAFVGMPSVVAELEHAVDDAAETKRWVEGDRSTVPALRREGGNFKAANQDNAMLVATAAAKNNLDLVRDLFAAGVSLAPSSRAGCAAVDAAARYANATMVDLLLSHRASTHWEPVADVETRPCNALPTAARSGVPHIVAALLKAGADVNGMSPDGQTALLSLAEVVGPHSKEQNYGETTRLLIAAGANVNVRDRRGESAVMKARRLEVIGELIKAHAADIDTSDSRGRTPLMNSLDPDVSLALLQAGADPYKTDKQGKTALDLAQGSGSQSSAVVQVLTGWLAAHPATRH